jgi:hypothetical protein
LAGGRQTKNKIFKMKSLNVVNAFSSAGCTKSVPRLAAGNPSRSRSCGRSRNSRRDFMKNTIFKISKKNHNVKKNWKKYKSCVQNLYVTNDNYFKTVIKKKMGLSQMYERS